MAIFRICLSGASQQLLVELSAANIEELMIDASTARFLAGHMAHPDEHGCYAGVMLATNRIQAVFETD